MKNADNSANNSWWQPGLVLFFKLSSWIGGPVIVAVFIGKYLDKHFKTEPWLFLLCVGIAFVFSMFALIYFGTAEMKKIEDEAKKLKNKQDK